MNNTYFAIGRLVKDPEKKTLENGKNVSNITLAVDRSYKNSEGVYETDFIDITLWENLANNLCEYCKKGDLIGIGGHLETNIYEKDGEKRKTYNVIASKVSFLSTGKSKDDNEVSNEPEME